MDLGRTMLVTGASRGIGKATALEAGRSGMNVLLVSHERERELRDVAEEVKTFGVNAEAFTCDLSRHDELLDLCARLRSRLRSLDVLVNNAARAVRRSIEDLKIEEWQRTIDLNLAAPFLLTRELLPLLRQGVNPTVINVASIAGRTGGKVAADYAASKGGLIALTKYMAGQLGCENFRINCVAPSPTATEMLANLSSDATLESALKEAGRPEEVAEIVVFLATAQGTFLNGECIYLTKAQQVF